MVLLSWSWYWSQCGLGLQHWHLIATLDYVNLDVICCALFDHREMIEFGQQNDEVAQQIAER